MSHAHTTHAKHLIAVLTLLHAWTHFNDAKVLLQQIAYRRSLSTPLVKFDDVVAGWGNVSRLLHCQQVLLPDWFLSSHTTAVAPKSHCPNKPTGKALRHEDMYKNIMYKNIMHHFDCLNFASISWVIAVTVRLQKVI